MSKPEFVVRITGDQVSPESIDVRDLFAVLVELRKAMCLAAGLDDEEVSNHDEAAVSLAGLAPGSANLMLVVSRAALAGAIAISQAAHNGDYSRIPLGAHAALAHVSRHVVRRGWEMQFLPSPSGPVSPARIGPDREVPDPLAHRLRGTTRVYGQLLRVGGEHPPSVRLRLAGTKEAVTIIVTEQIAKDLGHRLYEQVGLECEASWSPEGLGFAKAPSPVLRAKRVLPYRPSGDLEDAFRELAEAAHGRWDSVDVDEYVREMRSEDEE
jgi:hypothetical protein